jgi:hypothetical protein
VATALFRCVCGATRYSGWVPLLGSDLASVEGALLEKNRSDHRRKPPGDLIDKTLGVQLALPPMKSQKRRVAQNPWFPAQEDLRVHGQKPHVIGHPPRSPQTHLDGTQESLWSNLGMLLAEHNMSVLALHKRLQEKGVSVNLKSLYRLAVSQPLQKLDARIVKPICKFWVST